ncbi:hypothetical protein BFAG_01928 [Bacteroides fragilis 3_1_12]|uniref:SWIM-type domain-containing protein n=1 Tax=Bacteroides fragilis 3_1_12 TaxID=457424 RepID=A0ABN0BK42_BACFG|nr:hypothetical protein BFAG_01928 [Bacteroides fragilis 3_1_12]
MHFTYIERLPNNGVHLNMKGLKIRISACSCEITSAGGIFCCIHFLFCLVPKTEVL